ncbi:MAG TPA: hemerythrin domain-containing protein [Egibacteraceae bacterium]|nr:hemerythrin domain-containing protein [Egibacteraceae bacterium]
MDALELLKSDHDTVRELFEQFSKAKEAGDTQRLAEVQQKIFAELEVHTSIEEEVFYPEAEQVGEEAEELVKEGVEEHHVVEVLMGEIAQLQPDDDAWVAKMTVLIENVEHHAEEEEEELFPKLREVFGDERLAAMGQRLQEAKARRQGGQAGGSAGAEQDLTRDELYERAKEQDVPGRSSMTKDELAEAVGDEAS